MDPLTILRVLLLSLTISVVLLTAVLLLPKKETSLLHPFVEITVLLGIVLHGLFGPFVARRMARPSIEEALIPAFRTCMWLGIILSEAVVLASLVMTFVGGAWIVLALGSAFALIGFWRAAPSQHVFQRTDGLLAAQGKSIRLTEAWRRTLEGGPPPNGTSTG